MESYHIRLDWMLILPALLLLVAGCASSQGKMHSEISPSAYPFAIVAAESAEPEVVARHLIERGYRVILAPRSNVDPRAVPADSVLLAVCQYLGHTGNIITGTSANISCSITDFSTGEEIYSSTAKYMGVTTESADIRGAIGKAFEDFPHTARTGSIAQVSALPWTGGNAAPDRRPPEGTGVVATGTAFYVDTLGHLLTNAHVVEQCNSVTMRGDASALDVVREDSENDLAVLKAPDAPATVATFREGRGIRSGDGVVAVGFPLSGLLASEANITAGGVSALAGLGDDFRFLQITAPVQPGNSGGPLLDASGRVVGIVTSKLNAIAMARATGDIPQNVNFAVNASVARILLDAIGVQYATGPATVDLPAADIGEMAKAFTVQIECRM